VVLQMTDSISVQFIFRKKKNGQFDYLLINTHFCNSIFITTLEVAGAAPVNHSSAILCPSNL
jgi:hypothetical protein